jgi:alpha-L-fucosidase
MAAARRRLSERLGLPARPRSLHIITTAARSGKKDVAINYKNKSFPENAAVLDIERGQPGARRRMFWQTDASIDKRSWGYIGSDLIDIVSKNRALLLNIGPRPGGTIPEEQERIPLKWTRNSEGLTLETAAQTPTGYASTFKIEGTGEAYGHKNV